MTIETLADRIAICELKARYCGLLGTKQWDAWSNLFTEDFALDTSEAGGPPPIAGRDEALASVRAFIEAARTVHHVHAPEISIDRNIAHGICAMQDRVVLGAGPSLTGYGHYTETYVKRDGTWRIAASKLARLFIDFKEAEAA
ncbi:nuclear transport factor 2 family protein [Sphingomonas sp. SUN039]|uniref:nuclear transport factor 2 family protein n=1 Tax=Sphingomonas sp. SUN039 TaxID=2937787 RepID=UPI0021642DF3|nr:nuclear transport factor 2 family protein [Sphingomonas sp. SUN039]UVO53655.1 nuclear transport factor 2 family protein [Sphingomonas sp. SUN039]